MIGNYGRTALGGRVGNKRNRKVNTISPKGSKVKVLKPVGKLSVEKGIGKIKVQKNVGSIKKQQIIGKINTNNTVGKIKRS